MRRRGGGVVVNLTNTEQAVYFDNDNLASIYYPIERTITAISTRDIQTLAYSANDGETWNNVALPFSGTLNLSGEILWKATSSTNNGFLYINTGTIPAYTSTERVFSFSLSGQIVRDYHHTSGIVTQLKVNDVTALSYSANGIDWTTVTLPWTSAQAITLNGDMYWKAEFANNEATMYLQTNNHDTPDTQERIYFLNDFNRKVRDYFYNPLRIININTDLQGLQYSYDNTNWFALVKGVVLFDNIWIKTSSNGSYLNIVGELDTTQYDAGWLGGQSNALGNTLISTNNKYHGKYPYIYTKGNGLQVSVTDNWSIMEPGYNDNVLIRQSGLNSGFAKAFNEDNPSKFLFYYKNAVGGTSLPLNWINSGGLYESRVTNGLIPALTELIKRKVNVSFKFFQWVQGEADSNNLENANNRLSDMTILLTWLKRDIRLLFESFGLPYYDFLTLNVKIKTGVSGEAYADIIRTNDDVLATILDNRVINVDADNYKSESTTNVHHTINELIGIGIEMYGQYKINK